MRRGTANRSLVAAATTALALAGCPGGGPDVVCGDDVCADGEDTSCLDCTFEEGESLQLELTPDDWQTLELEGRFGVTEAALQMAFAAAKPAACTDMMGAPIPCYEFTAFGTRWVGAWINNADGAITVRASGTRDWVLACQDPSGVIVASDDFMTGGDCAANGPASGECDPQLILSGAGLWLCLLGASPYPTNADPYGTLVISALVN